MRMLFSSVGLLALSLTASAATVTFDAARVEGPVGTSATVGVSDIVCNDTTPNCVQVIATFNGQPGDITGIFFEMNPDFVDVLTGFAIANVVPTIGYNTEQAPNGAQINPLGSLVDLGTFDVALGIGSVGGNDVFQSVIFGLKATGLTATAFNAAAVRVQSIGTAGASGKYFDGTPTVPGDDPSNVPEPSTYAMLGSALIGLAALRLKRK